jgi:hypothetical protein
MKCSICKGNIPGLPKESTSEEYDGEPIICCQCSREEFSPGTVIELDFDDEPYKKFNGIKGIIVRLLGCHEDLAGSYDYVVSWDWKDERLFIFLTTWHGNNLKRLLDPRMPKEVLKKVEN